MEITAPQGLLEFPPLALFANGFINAFNELRCFRWAFVCVRVCLCAFFGCVRVRTYINLCVFVGYTPAKDPVRINSSLLNENSVIEYHCCAV